MKILAFVDLHGWFDIISKLKKKAHLHDVDLILCAGDITIFGQNQKKVLKKLNDIGKPMLIIPGNHEQEDGLMSDVEEHDNIIYLHQGSYRIDDYIFFGYGSGGFAVEDPDFEELSKHFLNDINPKDKVVLLVHGPPHGTKVDLINGKHAGNKSITKFINDNELILVVTGHLHETAGVEDNINGAKIVNPGPEGMIFDI